MPIMSSHSFSLRFLHLALLLFIVEFVRGSIIYAFLPVYGQKTLGMSIAVVGMAVTAHSLVDLVGKTIAGAILDHLSVRWVIMISMLLAFFGLLALPWMHVAWGFIAAAALFGVGISPVWLVAMSLVEERLRSTQMGLLYAFWLIGTGGGLVLTNFFLDHQSKFPLILSLILWALGILSTIFLSNQPIVGLKAPRLREQWSALKRQIRHTRPLLPGMLMQTLAAGMLIPVLPDFVSKHLGITYSDYSYVLMSGGAVAMLALLPMGRLADHFGKKWFLVVGFLGLSTVLWIAPLLKSVSATIVLAILLGGFYASVLPAWNALLAQYVPKDYKGMGWGLFSSIEGIGVLIGPALGGFIALHFSTVGTIVTSAFLLLSIAVFYGFSHKSFFEPQRS
ncbi:MAG: MFS transporter [Candidatus Carbobacillus sp.]|nr:MFS transporter [Candidatus Carbobacillus sp.]